MNKIACAVSLVVVVLATVAGIAFTFTTGVWEQLKPQRSPSPEQAHSSSWVAPGPIDIGFAQSMLVHHEQAVLMAQIVQPRALQALGSFTKSIETAQLLEMGQMQGWLALWGKPLATSGMPSMDWMLLGPQPPEMAILQFVSVCRTSPSGMPGMATPAELDELRRLSGHRLASRFFELMIAHHQAALPMAEFASKQALNPAVRKLAQRMVDIQTQEISHMSNHGTGHSVAK
jgi:uncharacterized protein (DUF305 family)